MTSRGGDCWKSISNSALENILKKPRKYSRKKKKKSPDPWLACKLGAARCGLAWCAWWLRPKRSFSLFLCHDVGGPRDGVVHKIK